MGSLGWFVCSFRCDPGLHVAVVCQKQKGCLVAIWTTALENCAKRCLLAENLKPREIFHGGILVLNKPDPSPLLRTLFMNGPISPTILYVAPTTWRVKNYVIFGLKLLALQSVNFKSDDRFVVPGPNGRGSFEAWLAKAPISSHILLFWIGALGVLSRPWIGTCMARTCMKRTF